MKSLLLTMRAAEPTAAPAAVIGKMNPVGGEAMELPGSRTDAAERRKPAPFANSEIRSLYYSLVSNFQQALQ
jgi:hypothetical protein